MESVEQIQKHDIRIGDLVVLDLEDQVDPVIRIFSPLDHRQDRGNVDKNPPRVVGYVRAVSDEKVVLGDYNSFNRQKPSRLFDMPRNYLLDKVNKVHKIISFE